MERLVVYAYGMNINAFTKPCPSLQENYRTLQTEPQVIFCIYKTIGLGQTLAINSKGDYFLTFKNISNPY